MGLTVLVDGTDRKTSCGGTTRKSPCPIRQGLAGAVRGQRLRLHSRGQLGWAARSRAGQSDSNGMTGISHQSVEVCRRILKRILPELEKEEEQPAINALMAWLTCCEIETELLDAEENLDDEVTRQYLLTYRNKLSNNNYLANVANGPSVQLPNSPGQPVKTDWLGPLDDCSERLLHTVIRPDAKGSWEDTPELKEELDKLYSWDDFNIFKLTVLTNGHPLEVVAMKVFKDFAIIDKLNLDEEKLRSFLKAAELTYRADNKYHNNIHAADVTQSLGCLMSFKSLSSSLVPIELLAIVLAAITHDLGHPGLNNDFLVNSCSEEAKIYHDQSVNENMHLRYAFKLLEKPENNFICNLNREDYWFIRQALIKIVLSTDMATHTTLLSEFENHIAMQGKTISTWNHSQRLCALAMFVHCADIANPAKPGPFARTWTYRVMEEFYSQGDKERELAIAISAGCIRGKVNVPKNQITLLKYFVRPNYEALAHLYPDVAKAPLAYIEESMAHWRSVMVARGEDVPDTAANGCDSSKSDQREPKRAKV